MSRKVILGFGISLDGYIARRNGALDFLVIDKEGEALMADFFANIDTTIMGRKTAAATAKMRKNGQIPEMPSVSNYVFSRRWKPGKRDGFQVVSGSLKAFVKKLKRRPGKDIYLGGVLAFSRRLSGIASRLRILRFTRPSSAPRDARLRPGGLPQ